LPERPAYREVKSSAHGGAARSGSGSRPYFGSIPDYSQDQPGLALSGVTKDGPADKAGLRSGDLIVKFGDTKVGNIDDFDAALRTYKAGDKVPVVVKRDGKETTLTVTLGAPR
jgi:S1-C subfamily serine protease